MGKRQWLLLLQRHFLCEGRVTGSFLALLSGEKVKGQKWKAEQFRKENRNQTMKNLAYLAVVLKFKWRNVRTRENCLK